MEFERLKLCVCQIRELEEQRAEWFRQANLEANKCSYRQQLADRLLELCGIGMETAWTLATELFSWRGFRNRRQLGAVVGLTPTPYSSGHLNREQGISKAGRGDVRRLLVEVAWLWLRYQPQSELTRWYMRKVAGQGTRIRRIAIVALARKLLIALWKYSVAGGCITFAGKTSIGSLPRHLPQQRQPLPSSPYSPRSPFAPLVPRCAGVSDRGPTPTKAAWPLIYKI